MSLEAMTWVFKHSETTLGSRLVLLALADYAHDDGSNAWPSYETLARKARMSKRQTIRVCKALEEAGHIARDGVTEHGTVRWRVVLDSDEIGIRANNWTGDNLSPPEQEDPGDDAGQGGDNPSPLLGEGGAVTNPTARGDISDRSATEMSPNPLLEPSENPNTPQPPPDGGGADRRGGNPRAMGTNPRAVAKHGPPKQLTAPSAADRQAWADAQQAIIRAVGETQHGMWVLPLRLVGVDGDALVLDSEHQSIVAWTAERMSQPITDALGRPWRAATPADRPA